jgi:hypothetical protein
LAGFVKVFALEVDMTVEDAALAGFVKVLALEVDTSDFFCFLNMNTT